MGYFSAFWSSSRIVSKSKLVPSVFIKHITELITGDKSYYRGGRYKQVSLHHENAVVWIIYVGLILGLRANERRRYKVTPSLICWAQT